MSIADGQYPERERGGPVPQHALAIGAPGRLAHALGTDRGAGWPLPDVERLGAVHEGLISWYRRHGRDLPWRRTRDPYAILVSEIMLQQTQVERVRPKFHEFLEAFPTFASLAAASVADVIRRWAPLGYNRRAVRLHAIARAVVERLGGSLPSSAGALRELEGLGSYTANAIACFAHEQQVAVVDTNVRRVLGRLFADLIGLDPPGGRKIEAFAEAVLPPGRAYDWNQALMDLGATVCTARAPACLICPLALSCVGRPLLAEAALRPPRAAERRTRYTTQEPFQQTTRYFRGRIVDQLRGLGYGEQAGLDELGRSLKPDYAPKDRAWVEELVSGLERDGLAAVTRAAGEVRVSLP